MFAEKQGSWLLRGKNCDDNLYNEGAQMLDKKTQLLGNEKLASSGLTQDDAKKLGMEILPPGKTSKLHKSFKQLVALKINYYDHCGQPLADWPGGKPFYRLRYLESLNDFTELTNKKPVRYVQEPNTAPVAYYPRGFIDWADVVSDPDCPIVITEGELKAAKACSEGFPTLGLGGVYNWRSAKLGVTWLASLDPIVWLRRNVYICFDSDYRVNPLVCKALKDFADELHRRGSFTYLVSLPQLPGLEKVGLDDFLVHAGSNSTKLFEGLLSEAEPLGLTAPLFDLNTKYVYIKNPGFIVDYDDVENKLSPAAFKDHHASTQLYQEKQLRADGSVSYKAAPAAAAWLRWPLRLEAKRLTYRPGSEKFTKDQEFNTWLGWGCRPKKGDITLFHQLLDHIFQGAEPEALKWFLKWCAFPLQYPGTKLFSAAVIHGVRHGTGKSLVGYTLGKIYGKNFTEIKQSHLHADFNEWAENKQFIMGDDITGSNSRQDADVLKKLITQHELRINIKHVRSFVIPDCVNYLFTSQHSDSFFLEDDDRRFFIHEVIVGPKAEDFYMDYALWLDSGGSQAVFDYLLHLDLSDFNPSAPAFRTQAKERMITTVQSDLGAWVRELLATPDAVLKIGGIELEKDLFSSKELLNLYDPGGKTGTTPNGLARELARSGVRQVCGGVPIRLPDGSQGRYYDVRNPNLYGEWTLGSAKSHLEGHIEGVRARGRKRSKAKY